jgi:hypothetical protein
MKWVFSNTDTGVLLLLFVLLQNATANTEGKWLNALPNLQTFVLPNFYWGR